VSSLRRLDAGVDGFYIAKLADHYDIGIHAQSGAQGGRKLDPFVN
jgi:hypothetical protein